MAVDKGEVALAEVARRKAEQVDSDSLGNIYRLDFNALTIAEGSMVCSCPYIRMDILKLM